MTNTDLATSTRANPATRAHGPHSGQQWRTTTSTTERNPMTTTCASCHARITGLRWLIPSGAFVCNRCWDQRIHAAEPPNRVSAEDGHP
jgi:hypothetical protein